MPLVFIPADRPKPERNLWPLATPVLALAAWAGIFALVGVKAALLGAAGLAAGALAVAAVFALRGSVTRTR